MHEILMHEIFLMHEIEQVAEPGTTSPILPWVGWALPPPFMSLQTVLAMASPSQLSSGRVGRTSPLLNQCSL